jgi:hypothetical protein
MIKRFNISVPKKYTKDGEEKTAWSNVGSLTVFPPKDGKPEGYKIELPIFGETQFFVFEQKAKEEKKDEGSY